MGSKAQFMIEDPSRLLASNQNRQRFRCQTCFVSFTAEKKLREHVGAYQLEGQRLAARLVEVQMHLPRTESSWNEIASTSITIGEADDTDSDSRDDDDDLDNGEDDDDDDDDEYKGPNHKETVGHPSLALYCPYAQCRRLKGFTEHKRLRRHFETHIRCHELCVYCRSPSTRVSHYVRHKCTRRATKNDAKEFYTKERRAQLRNFAVQQLEKLMMQQKKETGASLKRRADSFTQGIPSEPRKRQTAGERLPLHNQPPHDCFATEALVDHANTEFSLFNMPMPGSSLQFEPQLGGQQMMQFAPIFDDITIPPAYSMGFVMPDTQNSNGNQHP